MNKIRKGDEVVVRTGKDKGRRGTVLQVFDDGRGLHEQALRRGQRGHGAHRVEVPEGLVVLFAAVQSTIDERRFESAMLRALGAKRRIVFAGVMAEFAALGVAAGFLAAAGASIVTLQVSFAPGTASNIRLSGRSLAVCLVGVSGVLQSDGLASSVRRRPCRRCVRFR